MDERQALAQLRAVLADLYPDPGSIRRIAFDAGLDETKITFSGPATDMWHAALREAQKKGQVKAIIWVAMAEYPGVPALGVIWEGYPDAVHHEKVVPPIPEITTASRRGCSLVTPWFSIAFMVGTITLFLWVGSFRQDIMEEGGTATAISIQAAETATAAAKGTANAMPSSPLLIATSTPIDLSACVTVAENGVNLREGPGTNYRALTALPANTPFQPLAIYRDSSSLTWLQVEILTPGITGWILAPVDVFIQQCNIRWIDLPSFDGELPPTPIPMPTSTPRVTENSATVTARETVIAPARATLAAMIQNMFETISSGTISETSTPEPAAIPTPQP